MSRNKKETYRSDLCADAQIMSIAKRQPPEDVRHQEGQKFSMPMSLGVAAYVENMRQCGDYVAPVGTPLLLGNSTFRPVFCISRGDQTHIFSLSGAGTLRHALTVDADGNAERVDNPVGTLSGNVRYAHTVGDFTAVLMEDDTVHYLMYDHGTGRYRILSAFPDLPPIDIVEEEQPQVRGSVAAMTFTKPVKDFRGDIDPTIAGNLCKEIYKGAQAAERAAGNGGVWVAPVAVRYGMRLWDGRLVALSSPVILGAGINIGNYGAKAVLRQTDEGFTGTNSTDVLLDSYHIMLKPWRALSESIGEDWLGLVKQIEVWVSETTMVLSGSSGEPYFRQENGGYVLGAHLDCLPQPGAERMVGMKMRRVAVLSPEDARTEIRISRDSDSDAIDIRPDVVRFMPERAGSLTAHDGFMHMGAVSRRLPRPDMPRVLPQARDLQCYCKVVVELRTTNGLIRTDNQDVLSGLDLRPLLWYPDSRAERMWIHYIDTDGDAYSAEFPLTPVAGEDAACYISDSNVLRLDEKAEPDPVFTAGITPPSWEIMREKVVTAVRGNPFAVADESASVGSAVRELMAMPAGGGAFTRQFIYIFTDNGVTALNHDMSGRYTNLRAVSGTMLPDIESAVATPTGVYFISRGVLQLLKESKVKVVATGITEYRRLLWNDSEEELWLLPHTWEPNGNSLAIYPVDSAPETIPASVRTIAPELILRASGCPIVASKWGSTWNLYYLEDKREGHTMSSLWRSNPFYIPFSGPGLLRVRALPTRGGHFTMKIEGEVSEEDGSRPEYASATVKRAMHDTADLGLVFPPGSYTPRDSARFSVTVQGMLSGFKEFSVLQSMGRVQSKRRRAHSRTKQFSRSKG